MSLIRFPRRRALALPAVLLAAAFVATACGGHDGATGGDGRDGSPGGSGSAAAPAAAHVIVTPAAGGAAVSPGTPVRVTVTGGTLAAVTVTPNGAASDGVTPVEVTGALDAGRRTWTSDRTMTPGTSYTVRVTASDAAGRPSRTTSTFATAAAARVNGVTPTPLNHAVVGVGLPVSLAFDKPVADRAAVERALRITTTPAVHGSWGWLTDPTTGIQRVDWRPDTYWRPGTTVTLTARLSGIDTGGGRYLRRDIHDTFTIGTARISYVDLRRHTMRVTENGRTVRTFKISGGRPAYPTWNGRMVVLDKQSTVRMTSASVNIATSKDSADFYDEDVKDAVRITTSGTFVHAAPWNASVMGISNASHGCVGMDTADARWFFDRATRGDLVVTSGSTRATVDKANGYGEWNLSLAQWRALSALA
ncbi:L,D-transpeptidase [Actinacidiphila acidipaludis]|uniref:L,D-transpeptidase family protein n=1 Tax=Actinacidiphila acidipaludis TaxID=2873382 RepID=A0ABS7QEI9_9ACTN|nr:Ig-like domain-containing protein [Streptomyces acidipaludis]MBY8881547.1 L,D-transpeptidase family protein [Streptomyces acidipaludis]